MLEVYKESGLTPLEFINNIKKQYPLNRKICYTARLDPMAKGVVPILFDEECKDMHLYTNLNKTYEVKVFFGYKTDSDDALGLLENTYENTYKNVYDNNYRFEDILLKYKSYFEINNNIDNHNEIIIKQKYHYFSTKTIAARNKNIKEINVDYYHDVKLYSSKIINSGEIDFLEWVNECTHIIDKVDKTKNFRQKEIIDQWQKLALQNPSLQLQYITLQLHVGSGFFVRQYIRDISDKIGIPLMCYDINRVSIDYVKK